MSLPSLFRQQVLCAQPEYSPVVPWHVPQLRRWAWLLLSWVVLSLLWVVQLSYADKVSVQGVVQPVAAPVVVHSPVRGTVKSIHVGEGAAVQTAQALLVIDRRQLGATGLSDAQLRWAQNQDEQATLRQRLARLRDIQREQQHLATQQQQSAARKAQLLIEQVKLAKQRTAAVRAEHERALQLQARQWLSPAEVQQREIGLVTAQQSLLNIVNEHQALQALQQELVVRQRIQHARDVEQIVELEALLNRLVHDAQRMQVLEHSLVPAPLAGRVADLLIQPGRHVVGGEPLLTINPPAAARHPVDVLLPSSAAASVRAGMPVHLRYAGYPHQEHGTVQGRVGYVSEVQQANSRTAQYRARIFVDELPASMDKVPAGMVVSADIVLRAQPLWRWLWDPVASAFSRL